MNELPPNLLASGVKAVSALNAELNPELQSAESQVFALSEFAASAASKQLEWFRQAAHRGDFERPFERSRIQLELDTFAQAPADMAALQKQLRQVRQRLQLWLVWRHCLGLATLDETMAGASALADELIDAALNRLQSWLYASRGVPMGAQSAEPQSLVVIALGKLGAEELNLSSDVDLMFCFPEQGHTSTASADSGQVRASELNQQFFVRLGQQLIQALDPMTEDGFVFRVDMRLRPYGASGPLAVDFASVEDYYATQGRDWERYALMKARPCAGDKVQGQQLLDDLAPFVFRRYLDFGAIDALRDMKARLVADRQHPDDVKLGRGGIREVEFSVQMQQMIWGGRETELRSPKLLTVIRRLEQLGHFSASQVETLVAGYRFLRNTEHSLQAEADRQTQRLPQSDIGQARLAACMGFADFPAFQSALDEHRSAISRVFDALLGEQPESASEGLLIWTNPENLERLAAAGFHEPETASVLLNQLITARDRAAVSGDARSRLDTLMPYLLDDILTLQAPDLALARTLPVLRAVLRRSAYLSLLTENPHTRRHFVELVSTSLWLAENLADHPAFFDALLDERLLTIVPDREVLARELDAELAGAQADFERALETLREFKSHHVFNVALAELRGTLPLMKVSDALTWLAEAMLAAALRIAWDDNLERFPEYAEPRPFIIVGYGKLGGIELGPGSDLDLVFIHDLPATASQFLHRLVRRLLHVLTAPTYNGTLYEIDTRLRPSGNAGTMISSLDAFLDYQQKKAWTWEHQALVRARVVAGDQTLGERFDQIRRKLLGKPRNPEELAQAVKEMRQRMSAQLAREQDSVDLKRGSGGIVDIEFMVQYLVLAHASDHPSLTEFTDNVRILDAVEAAGLLPEGAAGRLKDAYLGLRAEWHRSVLDIPDTERAAQTLSRYRDDVRAIWATLFNESE